jgi:hypothetical protein
MKFKLNALVHLYLRENSYEKKKRELPMYSEDLDNLTYGLFKKLGRYSHQNPCV